MTDEKAAANVRELGGRIRSDEDDGSKKKDEDDRQEQDAPA